MSEEGPLLVDTPAFPEVSRPSIREMVGVLEDLRASDQALDWFVLSPPRQFGAKNPGSPRGEYRIGDDVALSDHEGGSYISGADYALAFISEVERPLHRRRRFTVAY